MFARSFNGMEVKIGDVKFPIIEASILVETELPQEGERWFKNKDFNEKAWRIILHNPGMDITVFKCGVMKRSWRS